MLAHDAHVSWRRFGPQLGASLLLALGLLLGWGALAAASSSQPILLFSLHVEAGQFRLTAIEGRTGFMPDNGSPVDTNDLYTLLLLDARGNALATQQFALGRTVWGAPWAEGDAEAPHPVVMPAVLETVVTAPDLPGADGIEIYDLNGTLLLRETGLHDRVQRAGESPTTIWEDISTPCCGDNCLDLLFLGDDYTTTASLDMFRSDVSYMANYFRQVEPYSARPNVINVRAIASTTDLECNYNCFGTPRLICCNGNIILPLASQAPHDKIIVLVNNNEYGGSGSVNFAVAYHRFPQYGPQVAIHEFSHSFALLGDEYSFGPNNGGNPLRANCDDNASCPRWNGMPGTSCIPGCTYNEWYRATNDCLMLRIRSEPASGVFCPVCRAIIGGYLAPFSDAWSDTDCDGATDVLDITRVARAWNDFVQNGSYDPNFDVDNGGTGDGDIDIVDVSLVSGHLTL
ncbi:MAG: M64 family metallopeptidase [Anaerolineae bacterium]